MALEHVAEVLDELLPDREANDAMFRLAVSVLHQLRSGFDLDAADVFQLWMVRLVGFLPELGECIAVRTGAERQSRVLPCAGRRPDVRAHKRLASSEMSAESRAMAAQMFRAPVDRFAERALGGARAADLRKFLAQIIERHIEKKLVTARMLEKM